MTIEQALAEAKHRWGVRGFAKVLPPKRGRKAPTVYQVGKMSFSIIEATYHLLGQGDSWESAFANADANMREHETATA